MLLGQARGKVGSLVFSRSNGKQIIRAKADKVKNPQTETQMIQRIILNTIAQAYSNFNAIVDHSFEGVAQGQPSMSHFMRRNIDALRRSIAQQIAAGYDYDACVAFTPLGSSVLVPNTYVMSTGSLPAVNAGFASPSAAATRAQFALSANTYAAVIEDYGLQRGDQLTFVTCQALGNTESEFHFARVILDPTDAAGNALPLDTQFLDGNGGIAFPSPRNEGTFGALEYDAVNNVVAFNLVNANRVIYSAGIIVSRKKTDGTWSRSTCQMVVSDAAVGVQPSLQYCLDAFAAGGIDALSQMYLNNAGRGRVATGGSAAATLVSLWTVRGSQEDPADYSLVNIVSLEHYIGKPTPTSTERDYIVGVTADGQKYLLRNYDQGDAENFGKLLGWEISSSAPPVDWPYTWAPDPSEPTETTFDHILAAMIVADADRHDCTSKADQVVAYINAGATPAGITLSV